MSDAVKLWFEQGEHCIRLLLESGVRNIGDITRNALIVWKQACFDAGWLEMAELCEMLMQESESDKAKAEALFRLCVWFEAVEAELWIGT